MTFHHIPAGSVIERTYFAVSEHYGIGPQFGSWDNAAAFAQGKREELINKLNDSLGDFSTPEANAANADVQVRIDLRWVILRPDGAREDIVVESYREVHKLRTYKDSPSASATA